MLFTLFALAISASGTIQLPPGETHLDRPRERPPHAQDLTLRGHPTGSTLVLNPGFKGPAAIVIDGATNVTVTGFTIEGNRTDLKSDWYLPEHSEPFADYYTGNGILARHTDGLVVRGVQFKHIRAFPLLINACSHVLVESVDIQDSGTLTQSGINNTTGGILLEEGVTHFQIRHANIARITGNAIWTHSYNDSPRQSEGLITGSVITTVGRDAIQIGHATRIRVEHNTGSQIGFPADYADLEHHGTPVSLDTAGNVDYSFYTDNRFTDVNGECINLDGFHDGQVTQNSCQNTRPIETYPALHYAIVFGNNNPAATSSNIVLSNNTLKGFAYGGAFVTGKNNRIENNTFENLNLAQCGTSPTPARCNYALDQPDLLRSGLYLSNNGGRPVTTESNLVKNNIFQGYQIKTHCITAAPGVTLTKNTLTNNTCQ